MPKIVGVKFKKGNKIYYFSPEGFDIKEHDGVIVETAKGDEFATVVMGITELEESRIVQPLKPVKRIATDKDYANMEKFAAKRDSAIEIATEKIKKHNLDMKLVDAEYTFDGSKLVLYFAAEGRIDFRELVKDLASTFKIRIELRQIGIRDECKMLGGIAPCGRVCCCKNHLSDFEHVSIKMAKTQGLSLNPGKISGLCGRLMCCLSYENAHYAETNKRMPKLNSEVTTPDGNGTVVSINALREKVQVKLPKKDSFEFNSYPLGVLKFKHSAAEHIEKDNEKIDKELREILD